MKTWALICKHFTVRAGRYDNWAGRKGVRAGRKTVRAGRSTLINMPSWNTTLRMFYKSCRKDASSPAHLFLFFLSDTGGEGERRLFVFLSRRSLRSAGSGLAMICTTNPSSLPQPLFTPTNPSSLPQTPLHSHNPSSLPQTPLHSHKPLFTPTTPLHSHKPLFTPTNPSSLPQTPLHSHKPLFTPTNPSSLPQTPLYSHKPLFTPTNPSSLPQTPLHSHFFINTSFKSTPVVRFQYLLLCRNKHSYHRQNVPERNVHSYRTLPAGGATGLETHVAGAELHDARAVSSARRLLQAAHVALRNVMHNFLHGRPPRRCAQLE